MNSRFQTILVGVLTLGLVGAAADQIASGAWDRMRRNEPALEIRDLEQALGQGLTIGLLGGFRAITADFLWLGNNLAWEQRDLPKSQTLIRLVTTVDPRPLYFWINGARMIALDMPVWRIEAARDSAPLPKAVQDRITRQQAVLGLQYLQTGLRFHPENPFLLIEIANIYLRRLHDVETAARYYRRAALRPHAPYYAARIYAELLKQQGKDAQALEWLKEVYPKLSRSDPASMRDVVLERIRALEDKLQVPEAERFTPADSSQS